MGEKVVLYVEDEDAAWMLFESAVRTAELPVHLYRASDGEEALQFLRAARDGASELKPDLLILDLSLPRKDGWELLTEVKADQQLNGITVVVFTSSALPGDKRRSMALGANGYVIKPFTYDDFMRAVDTVCSYLPTG